MHVFKRYICVWSGQCLVCVFRTRVYADTGRWLFSRAALPLTRVTALVGATAEQRADRRADTTQVAGPTCKAPVRERAKREDFFASVVCPAGGARHGQMRCT